MSRNAMMFAREQTWTVPSPFKLVVHAAGLCCSVGYHLRAASCALRSNMDHFQESEFRSEDFAPIRVARLPDDIFGQERLQRWVSYAVRDCVQGMPDPLSVLDTKRTAVVVLIPDSSRSHADGEFYTSLVLNSLAELNFTDVEPPLPEAEKHNVVIISEGRAGLGSGLSKATQMLDRQNFEQVLLIGIESYLNAADMNEYLRATRLLVEGNSDGFLPGEAASVILLRALALDAVGFSIDGIGIANEAGRPDGSVPSRAKGLTHAIRSACDAAGINPAYINFRLSDQNGEQFFSREAANAMTRVMYGAQKIAHLTLADKIGEVGAATGPAMLAWLWYDMRRVDNNLGSLGLIHLSNDTGLRCAVVIRQQGEN